MALVACARCRQPFYASCHDSSCIDAVCPHCEYGVDEEREAADESQSEPGAGAA